MESEVLYNKYLKYKHWEKHPIIYAAKFAEFLKKHNFNGLIVDIGCGNGRDVNFFNESGFEVKGIDYSKEQIKNNKKNFPELIFEIQNVENLKFKKNSIDAFFMINVIHYVNKEKAINEIFKTLKSRGYLSIHFNIKIKDKYNNRDYYH